jgi:FkbM family methyltransferase
VLARCALVLELAAALGWRGTLALLVKRLTSTSAYTFSWPASSPPIRLRIRSTDLQTFKGIVIDEMYRLPFERAPEVVVDAGANIGVAAVWFARTYPDARVIALEPDPDNYRALIDNVRDYPNVVALQSALWDRSVPALHLLDPGLGFDGYRVGDGHVGDQEETLVHDAAVAGIAVPELMDRFGIRRIDVLKVNIEGGEKRVFDASDGWIRSVDAIAVELHDWIVPGCSRSFSRATSEFPHDLTRGWVTFVWR